MPIPRRVSTAAALLTSLLSIESAGARQLPFSQSVIAGGFDGVHDVAIGDIDRDGDLDVAAVAATAGALSWWENVGGLGDAWLEHTVTASYLDARAIALGDLDGDGLLDVVACSHTGGLVTWWENGSDGLVWTERNVDLGVDGARDVATADIDTDGDLDVVAVAELGGEVLWWENENGLGTTWTRRVVEDLFDGGHAIAVADVNSDGLPDITGASLGRDEVLWWENNGVGIFWRSQVVDTDFDGVRGISHADLDGDGDLDLIAAAGDDGEIRWYENLEGDGESWNPRTITVDLDGATSVLGFDLDQDGDADIIGTGDLAGEIRWWDNAAGDGTTWVEHTIGSGAGAPSALAAGDVDGDGDPDLAVPLLNDDEVSWWRNDVLHRSSIFPPEHVVTAGIGTPLGIASGDVDGDGDLDLASTDFDADSVLWWENTTGDGTAWSAHVVGSSDGMHRVHTSDVDSDGDLDLVTSSFFDEEISWFENLDGDGSDWLEWSVGGGAGAGAVTSFDMDDDGDIDIVGVLEVGDEISWWENLIGHGLIWVEHVIDTGIDGPENLVVRDIDGDGDADVIATAETADEVVWYENLDGHATSWQRRTIDGDFDGADSIDVADVDGDGDYDVAGTAENADEVIWWENVDGGASLWIEHLVEAEFDGATDLRVLDLDADGDADIVAVAENANELAWWENLDGDATQWFRRTITGNLIFPGAVLAGDVDGDGMLDIVAAAEVSDEIRWFENRGGQVSFVVRDVAPAQLDDGEQAAVLEIELVHEGRPGDAAVELAGLTLLFEESPGDPLTSTEGNALVDEVELYLDDGSGVFDAADVRVGGVSFLSLSDGEQAIDLVDDDPDLQVAHGTTSTYFVTLLLTTDAGVQTPNVFQIAYRPLESVAEDAASDIPLSIQLGPVVTTKPIEAGGGAPTLTVSGECPGPVTIAIAGAEPGGNVPVIFSPDLGSFTLPFGSCAGTEFGLDAPTLLFTLVADGDGNAQTTGNAPANACGAYLQAMDVTSCVPTNVFQVVD